MLSASRVALRPLLRPTQLGHYNHCKHGISSQAVTSQIRFLSTPPASKPKRVYVPQATTADGLKTTWFMGLMQQVSASRLFSEKLKMSLYPPFFLMGVSILTLRNSWREVKIKLPLNTLSRNPGGVMFGGYQAALADPIAALACSRVFPGYSCWTRAMTIDFVLGGSTDLELRFEFDPALEEEIRKELEEKGRATPTFTYGFYLKDGTLCTKIENVVAIRPKGYIGATTPPAQEDDFGAVGGGLEEMMREKLLAELAGGGGEIDLAAFEKIVHGVKGGEDVEMSEIEAWFKKLDKDESGVISLDEAREWCKNS